MNETLSQFLLLGTGWLNGLFLGWFIWGRKKQIKQEGQAGKNVGQVPPKRNPPPPIKLTSWILPPLYPPTVKKEFQMKPFDLEAAKRGDPIVTSKGRILQFIGVDSKGDVVAEDDEGAISRHFRHDILMLPTKRTVWVNLYKDGSTRYWYDSEETANKKAILSAGERICGKAFPVEIEE